MVGRGGMRACGLKSWSSEGFLWRYVSNLPIDTEWPTVPAYGVEPVPQTLNNPTSDGPVQARTFPVGEMMDSDKRLISTMWPILLLPISLRAGMENARALPSPKSPTRL